MFGQFLDGAHVEQGSDVLELRDSGCIDPGDVVTLSVAAATGRAVSLTVEAPFEKTGIHIQAAFASVPDGPTHPSQITIQAGDGKIVMKNLDYEKSD